MGSLCFLNRRDIARFVLVFALPILLMSCSSGSRDGFVIGSDGSGNTGTRGTLPDNSNDLITYCNVFSSTSADGNIRGAMRPLSKSSVELNFTRDPNGFTATTPTVLRLYKMAATPLSVSEQELVSFYLTYPGAPDFYGAYDEVSQEILDEDFEGRELKDMELILLNVPIQFQVLRIQIETAAGSVLDYYDALIPEFLVSPDKFALSAPTSIHSLHPLADYIGTGYSDEQYAGLLNLSHPYCL